MYYDEYGWNHGDIFPVVLNLLLCDDDDEAADPKAMDIPSSYHFKKRGLVVSRGDHEDNTPVFRLLAGPVARYGTGGLHWDALSISLSAFGQKLIVEPGHGSWKETGNHSSILIDGRGQETLCRDMVWPPLIEWHEKQDEFEYIMASATNYCYGECTTAERHALVVHESNTPFYVVVCDIFEYPAAMIGQEPALEFVLIADEKTNLTLDGLDAILQGPKAWLRASIVTRDGVIVRADRLLEGQVEHNPRVIWSRKGRHGRTLAVLIPLRDGIQPPVIDLIADNKERTSCTVRFGDFEDRITFWAPRNYIYDTGPITVKTGMRMKVVRTAGGKEKKVFTIPTMPGGYVTE